MSLRDFVNGGYPLPWEPVFFPNGVGDFVNGSFPLPQTPVFFPSSGGSLPKAPSMPRSAIAHGAAGPASPSVNSLSGVSSLGMHDMIRGFSGVGGCGCGHPYEMPRGFSGLGMHDMIRGFSGVGGCGCGHPYEMARGFSGMGTLATTDFGLVNGDTIIPQASLPTFLQGDNWITGFPNVYTAGVVVIAAVMFMGGKKGRR
jgi:hypothetical protein